MYVGRPTRHGNPFVVGGWLLLNSYVTEAIPITPTLAVALFRSWAERCLLTGRLDEEWLAPLVSRDLACWCCLDAPCHADVLLDLANR